MNALAYAIQLLSQLPALISAGVQVKGLIDQGTAALKTMQTQGRDPTQAEWDALDAQVKLLRTQLHR